MNVCGLKQRLPVLAAILLGLWLSGCQRDEPPGQSESVVTKAEPADVILVNGGIYTVNEKREWAQAAAIRNGEFVEVGSNEDIRVLAGEATRIIDLEGRMALPGFHDAHVHPYFGGEALLGCDLAEYETQEQILSAVADCRQASEGQWLIGHAFDLSAFGQDGPNKLLLDAIDAERPMVLWASDGHNAWVNSPALEIAGISSETPDPALGVIERNPDGSPSGTLRETAQELVRSALPEVTAESIESTIFTAVKHLNALGITSFIDAWVGEDYYRAYQSLDNRGELKARVRTSLTYESGFAFHQGEDFERVLASREQYETPHVRNDSIKIFLDGVLEGETAALLDDYVDLHHHGELILSPEQLNQAVTRFDAMGLQVHMHAIGDRAVRAGLDAVAAAREANGPSDNRHHISHLQLIDIDDIERFEPLNVSANFQSAWAYPDRWIMEMNLPVLGEERVQAMYPIGSIARAGGRLVGGSDWNVDTANTMVAIETAVSRQDPNGITKGVLNESERVSLAAMIDAYTINAAWLMHQENEVGSIERGKKADLVILDRNLFEIPVTEISEATVLETFLQGESIYRSQ